MLYECMGWEGPGQPQASSALLPFVWVTPHRSPALFARCGAARSAARDLWAASSSNPSPGSPAAFSAQLALNIQPDWGCAAAGGLQSEGCVSLSIYFFQTTINPGTNGSRINCENATVVCRRVALVGSDLA